MKLTEIKNKWVAIYSSNSLPQHNCILLVILWLRIISLCLLPLNRPNGTFLSKLQKQILFFLNDIIFCYYKDKGYVITNLIDYTTFRKLRMKDNGHQIIDSLYKRCSYFTLDLIILCNFRCFDDTFNNNFNLISFQNFFVSL